MDGLLFINFCALPHITGSQPLAWLAAPPIIVVMSSSFLYMDPAIDHQIPTLDKLCLEMFACLGLN